MDYVLTAMPKRIGRFLGFGNENEILPRYPMYYYKEDEEPLLIHSKDEEIAAINNGYDAFTTGMLSNKTVVNWFWDLEDLSPKQLVVFAKDEFGVELPADADQETLYRAVCKLSRTCPQNENRLVLIAQVMEMNLDATIAEIRRMNAGGIGVEITTEETEVVI